jgi:S-adenosylmethionine:diacylglycerol 3-amino-3-carboxypropyl transferase
MILHQDIERLNIALLRLQEECIRNEYRHQELIRDLAHITQVSQKILSRTMMAPTLPPQKQTSWSLKDFTGSVWVRNIAYAIALGISNLIVLGTFNLTEVIKTAFGGP